MSPASLAPRELFAAPKHFIGWITPSANTVVERITLGILRDFPAVSAHFSRTSVVGARDPFPSSYDFDDMLAAARLLADARLLKLPFVRIGNGVAAGRDEAVWKALLAAAR